MLSKSNRCENFMIKFGKFPNLPFDANINDAIQIMNNHKLGSVCIVDKNQKLKGIITDGDLRRILFNQQKPFPALMNDDIFLYCSKKPQTIDFKSNILKGLRIMNKKRIWDLPVVNKNKKLLGILHLHFVIKNLKIFK